jgi:hypothetical protein
MKFMSILLKEGRKEDLRKKYAKKFEGNDGLDFILNISDLQDFNHKYTDWVLKNVDPESENFNDDVEYIVELIKDFDKYSSQFPKKDINQYVSLNELESVINFIRTKNKDKELEKQADKIYEDDKFLVVKPKTEEASCKYGSNTKWCVTSKGSGHFDRYIAGRQGLYFIINKAKSTNKNYSKVAIHFNDEGFMRYWDAQDSPMSQREIDVFEYAFSDIIDSIKKDYEIHAGSMTDRFLTETFDKVGEYSEENRNYLNSSYNLISYVAGFRNIPDMGFGHTEGRVTISLIDSKSNSRFFDEYQVFITYKSVNVLSFTASIGFMANDDTPYNVDLGLEEWGIDVTYNIGRSPAETAEGVRRHISHRVLDHIVNNPKLVQKVAGTTKVWRASQGGYKFSKNKGMIKKLVDYLDTNAIGTKLDFLENIGTFKSKVVDGKKLYARSGSDRFLPSVNWRGQFGTFFSAAKSAGILNYRKVGKDFFLTKGPNFDAFKSGELKAL